MKGKLDQDTRKVKIEIIGTGSIPVTFTCDQSEVLNNWIIGWLDLNRSEKYIANMNQLRSSYHFIRLIPALAKGGGQPAHA